MASRARPIAPKGLAQKRYVDAIRENDIVFGIGPAGTGKTYLAMAMAVRALVDKEVKRIVLTRPAVEAGEKLGFLPGTMAEKVNPYLRPLYDALHDMMDFERAEQLIETRRHRGGAAGLHARAHAQRRVRHPRRGAEHDHRADEDVPHAPRLRLQGGGHRRRHADRSADGAALRACSRRASCSPTSTASRFCHFTEVDVVRHPLVQKIIKAYDARDAAASGEGRRASAAAERRPETLTAP